MTDETGHLPDRPGGDAQSALESAAGERISMGKMKLPSILCLALGASLANTSFVHAQSAVARISRDSIVSNEGVVLTNNDRLSTPGSFRPPVDITIVAKTDSTNLRIAYAADQVIFNWEVNGEELRVDGGPADGQHKPGAGSIATNKFVNIRWVVTSKKQSIYVDKQLRFEHVGDYSQIDRPVSVFAAQSKVTVKGIAVRQLPASVQ